MTYFDLNDENHNETETNEDGEAWKQKDNQNQKKLVSSTIKKSMLILFVSMIFLTISYLTYFGMFVFLKNRITTVQNVTVSGDGPIRKVFFKKSPIEASKGPGNISLIAAKCIQTSLATTV